MDMETAATFVELVELLCTGSRAEIMRAMEKIPSLVAAYQGYLEQFADRCLEELKLESETLHEDPLVLLRSIGEVARAASISRSPQAEILSRDQTQSDQAHGDQAEEKMRAALRGSPVRRAMRTAWRRCCWRRRDRS